MRPGMRPMTPAAGLLFVLDPERSATTFAIAPSGKEATSPTMSTPAENDGPAGGGGGARGGGGAMWRGGGTPSPGWGGGWGRKMGRKVFLMERRGNGWASMNSPIRTRKLLAKGTWPPAGTFGMQQSRFFSGAGWVPEPMGVEKRLRNAPRTPGSLSSTIVL